MRQVKHEEVLETLENRGYNLAWVKEYTESTVENASDVLVDDVSTSGALDWFEVEGQVYDGLFEDPHNGPEFDFTYFFTGVPPSEQLVGRMMYYMVSSFGTDYQYEDLVDDIETLADEYDAPFDRQKALSAKP